MISFLANPWVVLFAAALLEVVWAVSLKESHGFNRLGPSFVTIVGASISFWLLAIAMKQLPVGTAYTVWTGIGAIGTAGIGIMYFGDPASWVRLAGIALIIGGIVALKLG